LLNVTSRDITVQLTFNKPILVSQGKVADRIFVKLNKDLFLLPMRYQGANTVPDEDEQPYYVVDDELPMMFGSPEEAATVESLAGGSEKIMLAMIIVPMIAGVLLKGILAKLWAMISTFQLINALSMITVNVPNNVISVQTQSNAIINFNPFPKDLIMEWIFGPKEE